MPYIHELFHEDFSLCFALYCYDTTVRVFVYYMEEGFVKGASDNLPYMDVEVVCSALL